MEIRLTYKRLDFEKETPDCQKFEVLYVITINIIIYYYYDPLWSSIMDKSYIDCVKERP